MLAVGDCLQSFDLKSLTLSSLIAYLEFIDKSSVRDCEFTMGRKNTFVFVLGVFNLQLETCVLLKQRGCLECFVLVLPPEVDDYAD